MTGERQYTAAGMRVTIRDRARARAKVDQSVTANDLIVQNHRDRFLCRVFSDNEWVLKGGTGMLARIPGGRSTLDIDLFRNGYSVEQAVARLQELAEIDLEDHFRFEYRNHRVASAADNQPNLRGARVVFDAFIGATAIAPVKIDVVAGVTTTTDPALIEPAYRLAIPGLETVPYRVYPLADQIADKVCATMGVYAGAPSSMVKDLVDLVIIARTQEAIDARELRTAIERERRSRQIDPFAALTVPAGWTNVYARLARGLAPCAGYETIDSAAELVKRFLSPILEGNADGEWHPRGCNWR